jgi:hypothetical protein
LDINIIISIFLIIEAAITYVSLLSNPLDQRQRFVGLHIRPDLTHGLNGLAGLSTMVESGVTRRRDRPMDDADQYLIGGDWGVERVSAKTGQPGGGFFGLLCDFDHGIPPM